MSATMEAILTRRSCRKFKSDMISRPILEEIVQAGTYAATGMGKQSPIILADLGITGDYEGIGHCILGYPEEGGVRPAIPRKDGYVHWIE